MKHVGTKQLFASAVVIIAASAFAQTPQTKPNLSVAPVEQLRKQIAVTIKSTKPDFVAFIPQINGKVSDTGNEHFLAFDGPDGSLMAVWTQSAHEGEADQHIVFARSNNEGATWSKPKILAGPAKPGQGNIASWAFPLVSKTGRIYVLYSQHIGKFDTFFHHTGLLTGIYSDDNGYSWSKPQTIPMPRTSRDNPDVSFPPNCIIWQKPTRLTKDGRYLVGLSRWTSKAVKKNPTNSWISHDSVVEFMRFENLDDNPEVAKLKISWLGYDSNAITVPFPGHPETSVCQEPSIVKLPDGRLFCVMRTAAGSPYWTMSRDDGDTWTKAKPLLRKDGGEVLKHPLSPCPIFDLGGNAAASGHYALFIHNHDGHYQGFGPTQTQLHRRPIYLVAGHFEPKAEQPIWFDEPKFFMNHDGVPLGVPGKTGRLDLALYSSLTVRHGQAVLWYPDRKFFLLGKVIKPAAKSHATITGAEQANRYYAKESLTQVLALPKSISLSPLTIKVVEVISRDKKAVSLPETDRFSIVTSTKPFGKALIIDAEISELRATEAAARVICQLKLPEGWHWWKNLLTNEVIESVKSQSIYPLAVATDPHSGKGIAIVITPETPCIFSAGASGEDGLFIEARVGFSPLTKPASKVHLQFAIYPIDGEWGMRSAMKEYYSLVPKAFERRAFGEGLWLFFGDAGKLPNLGDFAYHEWSSSREPEKRTVELEKKRGLEIYPYVIVGQREVKHLDHIRGEEKPKQNIKRLSQEDNAERVYFGAHYTTSEAMEVLTNATLKNTSGIDFPDIDVPKFIKVITNSMLVGEDGDIVTMPREVPWGGKTLTFPLNPNPFLHGETNQANVGSLVLDEARSAMKFPCDGIYVDSLWRWGNFLNYRKEHFATTRIGLTYGLDGRPALDNSLEHLTFLDELGKLLHPSGRKVFGNGIRPGRFWHAQKLDVSGSEMGSGSIESFAFNRAATYHKPYLVLSHNMGKKGEVWDRGFLAKCFLFGFYGSGNSDFYSTPEYERIRPVYEKYLRLQREMNRLCWEPVTDAQASNEISVERFGDSSVIYFTLYDASHQSRETTLQLGKTYLHLSKSQWIVHDAFSGKELKFTSKNHLLQIAGISLNADGIGAIKLERK